jgi:TolB protein
VPGAFSTRIAYVTATGVGNGTRYELVVADADGFAPQSIVGSPEPLLSPAWSPDGRRLAYVSFEKGNSAIYMQDVATGSRELISSGAGINGAPSFSPDGSKMALTLSRTGNPEIFVRDMATGRTDQITQHWSIDTHRTRLGAGRPIHLFHVGPRRTPADLPGPAAGRKPRARHAAGRLQRTRKHRPGRP